MSEVLRTNRVITLIVTCQGNFMVLLDTTIIVTALPTIQSHLHTKKTAPRAALAAVAAVAQVPWPASRSTVESAAANHIRNRTAKPRMMVAIKIRVRLPS